MVTGVAYAALQLALPGSEFPRVAAHLKELSYGQPCDRSVTTNTVSMKPPFLALFVLNLDLFCSDHGSISQDPATGLPVATIDWPAYTAGGCHRIDEATHEAAYGP